MLQNKYPAHLPIHLDIDNTLSLSKWFFWYNAIHPSQFLIVAPKVFFCSCPYIYIYILLPRFCGLCLYLGFQCFCLMLLYCSLCLSTLFQQFLPCRFYSPPYTTFILYFEALSKSLESDDLHMTIQNNAHRYYSKPMHIMCIMFLTQCTRIPI